MNQTFNHQFVRNPSSVTGDVTTTINRGIFTSIKIDNIVDHNALENETRRTQRESTLLEVSTAIILRNIVRALTATVYDYMKLRQVPVRLFMNASIMNDVEIVAAMNRGDELNPESKEIFTHLEVQPSMSFEDIMQILFFNINRELDIANEDYDMINAKIFEVNFTIHTIGQGGITFQKSTQE